MSSGFISEAELAEQRRTRQEEWEKVRKPEEPQEVPEEKYDHRSLFERLEEQKQKRDLEFEETHKLKNMIRGLDDDEVDFLDLVEKRKMDAELRTSRDEARELKEYRDAVARAEEASLDDRIKAEIKSRPTQPQASGTTNASRSSQGRLLAGVVVRKRPASQMEDEVKEKKSCIENQAEVNTIEKEAKTDDIGDIAVDQTEEIGAMRCIGILPGLGSYPDSSDSEGSSDTDHELTASASPYDLCGRKITRPKAQNSTASH